MLAGESVLVNTHSCIPNREVSQEYMNAISTMNWHDVISSVNDSRKLLEAMWNIEKITK